MAAKNNRQDRDKPLCRGYDSRGGFSTLEILLAMTIFILVISAITLLSPGNVAVSVDSQTNVEALNKTEELLETEQALARKDFKMVTPTTTVENSAGVSYTKKVTVATLPDFFTKRVTASVSWPATYGRAQSVSLTALLTNFENAQGGDTCDSITTGDWQHPQIKNVVTDFATRIGDSAGTYGITDTDAYQGKLYVTVNNTTAPSPIGPKAPTSASDNNAVGTLTWSNPSRVTANDNSNASVSLLGTNISHYLKATNFGFSIPQTATITGITVDVWRSASGNSGGNAAKDSEVKIVKSNGSVGALNKALSATWQTSKTDITYGSSQDLWNETWTPTDINSSNFGAVIAVTGSGASTNRTASVDYISITVSYHLKTFFIFNIAAPSETNPSLLGSLDNGQTVSAGLNAVATAENYAFVANGYGANWSTCTQADNCAQLQIIDTTNPSAPTVLSNFKVPGVTGTGGQAVGQSIFYKDGYVYLGLSKTGTGPEFNIIDAHNLANPIWLGGYSVGNGLNAIYVNRQYAYLATANSQELITLNIGDLTHPTAIGGYDAPDSVGTGKSIYTVGDKLYLGRTVTAANPELYVLNNENPSAMISSALGAKEIGSSVNGLIARSNLVFIVTTGAQFQTWDASVPDNMNQYASPLSLVSGGTGISLDCEGNYFYAAANNGSGKGVLDVIAP